MENFEEGQELCPVCGKLNNLSASEFECDHFLAFSSENQYNWCSFSFENILDEIEAIHELYISNSTILNTDDELNDLFDEDNYDLNNVVSELLDGGMVLGEDKENNSFLSSGNGYSIYVKDKEVLEKTMKKLLAFKSKLKSIN